MPNAAARLCRLPVVPYGGVMRWPAKSPPARPALSARDALPVRLVRPASSLQHEGRVDGLAITPDGTWLATASEDHTARTWAADGAPRAVLQGHEGTVV